MKKYLSFIADDDGDGSVNEDCATPPPGQQIIYI